MELALHVVLVSATEMGHAVIAIEDFHWLDPSSRAFVDRLVGAAENAFLLVVITSRPEGIDRTFEGSVPSAPVISLEPMSTDEITEVVRNNAGPGLESSAFVAIAERAEGIPLFAEVSARNSEIGAADNLPVLLRASLLARLTGHLVADRWPNWLPSSGPEWSGNSSGWRPSRPSKARRPPSTT